MCARAVATLHQRPRNGRDSCEKAKSNNTKAALDTGSLVDDNSPACNLEVNSVMIRGTSFRVTRKRFGVVLIFGLFTDGRAQEGEWF